MRAFLFWDRHMRKEITFGLLIWSVCLIVFISYSYGVGGPYLLDDVFTLSQMEQVKFYNDFEGMKSFVFNEGIILGRSLTKASFLIDGHSWPSSPFRFKHTNILIHLLCALSLLLFVARLLSASNLRMPIFLAVTTFIFWAAHPYNISTTLYVVQRMTQLSSMFIVLGLFGYTVFRVKEFKDVRVSVILSYFFLGAMGALAILAKPTGATILLYVAVIEFSGIIPSSQQQNRWFKGMAIFSMVIFFVAFTYEVVINWTGYEARVFNGAERFIIQGRVLAEYLQGILLPAISNSSVYHDDIEYALLQGIEPSIAWWLLHALIVGLAFYFKKTQPIIFLGVMWFYAGHVMESTFLSLELKYEHRNYLPSLGPLLITAYGLVSSVQWLKKNVGGTAAAAWYLLPVVILFVIHNHTSRLWGNAVMLTSNWAAEKPYSLRSQREFIIQLDHVGFNLMAINTAESVSDKIDKDLSMSMLGFDIACENQLEYEKQEELFDANMKSKVFTSAVPYHLRLMLEPKRQECIRDTVGAEKFESFLENIADLRLLKQKRNPYARYLNIKVDYYISQKNFSKAIEAMLELVTVLPVTDAFLKAGDLFYSAGLYDESLEYYRKAQNTDLNRRFGAISRSDVIESSIKKAEIMRDKSDE